VEEWTNEETGVGADIAAGSHEEKGICALLVILPITKNMDIKNKTFLKELNEKFIIEMAQHKERIIKESPSRLLKIVNIPELYLLLFW